MSLLTICQNAAAQLNFATPTVVAAASAQDVVLLLRCARAEGKSLASRHAWQRLLSEKTFTTVAAAAQTSSVPTDFDRIVPESMFNRTTRFKVQGPVDSAEWQAVQSSLVTRIYPAFRIRNSTIYITPTPTAGQTVAYEYVSANWCLAVDGTTTKADWSLDTDTANIGINPGITEEVMTLGVIWRWRKAKRFDYEPDQQDYERAVVDLIMRDGSRPTLSSDPLGMDRVPRAPQVPDTLVFT